ncbi:MAG: response regulator transcription factor [Bacteroidota bacterium]
MRILLVEDEENLMQTLALNFELEGYEVVQAVTGKQALKEFKSKKIDLIVLDVMLPEMDGFTVCENIRSENKTVPIIFLTAKSTSSERVEGLKLGADDYLAKPFSLEELLIRVQNLLKRTTSQQSTEQELTEYSFGEYFHVNFLTYEIVGLNKNKHELGKKEIQLLKLLIERKNIVVARDEILEKVWGYDVFPTSRTIDNYILAFRKYFEVNPKEPIHFHSVRGVGYKFTD